MEVEENRDGRVYEIICIIKYKRNFKKFLKIWKYMEKHLEVQEEPVCPKIILAYIPHSQIFCHNLQPNKVIGLA